MATPRRQEPDDFGRLFLLGLVLGLIPMALAFLSVSWTPFCFRGCPSSPAEVATRQLASAVGSLGTALWVVEGVGAIILLFVRRLRPVGYALLMMLAIAPCVAVVGCSVRVPSPYS